MHNPKAKNLRISRIIGEQGTHYYFMMAAVAIFPSDIVHTHEL